MSYLPNCKNDLFISYRRVSNEGPDEWVDVFQRTLKKSLRETVGDVEIWRDMTELLVGQPWPKEIEEALDNAAIFLAIIVGTYLESPQCRMELDRFLGKLKDPMTSKLRMLVPIFKQPLYRKEHLPREIADRQQGFFFRYDPPDSDRFRTFNPGPADPDRQAFFDAIERIAQEIGVWLRATRDDINKQALGKVFVANAIPVLQLQRERLRSDLQQRGYLVVPELEYLWNANDLIEQIKADQEGAHACIHLVPRTGSREPKAFERARQQLELALQDQKGDSLPVMVWIEPGYEEHPSVHELLAYIENDLANKGAEIFECGLEEFKTEIFKKLLSAAPPPVTPVREVALLVEEGDIGDLGAINELLAERLKLTPALLKFSGGSPKDPARLTRALARCDQCLIFWGRQPQEWVEDVLHNEAIAGRLGKDRMCIYAPGPETEKNVFRTPLAHKILAADGLSEAELVAFFGGKPIAA